MGSEEPVLDRLEPNVTYLSRNYWADPLVRAGPPGPAACSTESISCRGLQADEGVGRGPGGSAPQITAPCPVMGKVSGTGFSLCSPAPSLPQRMAIHLSLIHISEPTRPY